MVWGVNITIAVCFSSLSLVPPGPSIDEKLVDGMNDYALIPVVCNPDPELLGICSYRAMTPLYRNQCWAPRGRCDSFGIVGRRARSLTMMTRITKGDETDLAEKGVGRC